MSRGALLRLPSALALLLLGTPAFLNGQVEEGKRLYRIHCQACHGQTGEGDGPMRDQLEILVPDLTTIALGNEGEFPGDEIHRIIDGRHESPGHGSRQMPVWGFSFQSTGQDAAQEQDVRELVNALTKYLESIQVQKSSQDESDAKGR